MSVYQPDNFAGRVNHAVRVMLAGQRTNRTFDTCFEMYDGAAVAVAIARRAEKNPRLQAAIPRYLCPHALADSVARMANRKCLATVARELREAAK